MIEPPAERREGGERTLAWVSAAGLPLMPQASSLSQALDQPIVAFEDARIAELSVDLGGVERFPRGDRPQFFARITVQSRQYATPPTNV
jgi:hypothetical protein